MSVSVKPRKKPNFYKASGSRKLRVEVGMKGFLSTCNSREKDCIKESYNILNCYYDKLKPPAVEDKPAESIEDDLEKELNELKQTQKQTRFQAIETGARNVIFIKSTIENPAQIAENIIEDIYTTKQQQTKFLLRLTPVEVVCKANLQDVETSFSKIADQYFKSNGQTFSIIFNHRNNDSLDRDKVIKLIADKVMATRDDHKVDLKNANVSILVDVIRHLVYLAVVPHYLKYKKYNLITFCVKDDQNV